MSIDNTITSLVEAIAANTAALIANTAALKGGTVPAASLVEAVKANHEVTASTQEPAKAEKPKAPKAEKPKTETPKPAPAPTPEPTPEPVTTPTPKDLTREIQQVLKPICDKKRAGDAKAILQKVGGGAANFGCIPREAQPAVLEALQALADAIELQG